MRQRNTPISRVRQRVRKEVGAQRTESRRQKTKIIMSAEVTAAAEGAVTGRAPTVARVEVAGGDGAEGERVFGQVARELAQDVARVRLHTVRKL